MKPTTVLGSAVVFSIATAAATSLFLRAESRASSPPERTLDASHLDELTRGQTELKEEVTELRRLLEARPPAGPAEARVPVPDEGELERAVLRVLERQRAPAGAPAGDQLIVAEKIRGLFDPNLDDAEKARIWEELREGGHVEAAVAEFERRAQAAPFDSMAQTELGWAYFQKMVTTGGGPEAGKWGIRGGDSLAHALELDETNWDARFSLALHLSYADMRGDSIRHLEVLLEQQPNRLAQSKHASAYLLLGNLYMDMGRTDAAKRIWSDGLRMFPNDEALRARLEAFE